MRGIGQISIQSKGFTLIEILVGMLVISLAIMCFSAALRQVFLWQHKQKKYEDVYITAQSLINKIVSVDHSENSRTDQIEEGKINGLDYSLKCTPIQTKKNYLFSAEIGSSGNSGYYDVTLQQCTLALNSQELGKEFSFYRTQFCCLIDTPPTI